MKLIHFSTLHSPQSTRIYHKFFKATEELSPHEVKYYCGGNSSLAYPEGVKEISGSAGGRIFIRLKNLFLGVFRVIKERPQYVQLHDPELLLGALFFRLFGVKVIYDSHENFPVQFTSHNKRYKKIEPIIEFVENALVKMFASIVIAATDEIFERFKVVHENVFLIENGPRKRTTITLNEKVDDFIYAGLLSPNRGIYELLTALEGVDLKINIYGPFSSVDYQDKCKETTFWKSSVVYHGVVSQAVVQQKIKDARYGIVSLENTENYEDSRPTKLYEYLANGSKVIVSKMPYMDKVVREYNLGYVFDLDSVESIRDSFQRAYADRSDLEKIRVEGFFDSVNCFDEQLLELLGSL